MHNIFATQYLKLQTIFKDASCQLVLLRYQHFDFCFFDNKLPKHQVQYQDTRYWSDIWNLNNTYSILHI